MEKWKSVTGYEDFYEISNTGRVKRLGREVHTNNQHGPCVKTLSEKILNPQQTEKGYMVVVLSNGGTTQKHRVHRMVLDAFCGECPDGHEACHNNGDPSDNRIENLRWDTRRNNRLDMKKHGTMPDHRGTNHPLSRLNNEKVNAIRILYSKTNARQRDLAYLFDVSLATINGVLAKRTWSHVEGRDV